MTLINYIKDRERGNAANLNRALRDFIAAIGLMPDGDSDQYIAELTTILGGGGGGGPDPNKADLVSGIVPSNQLAGGIADISKFLRGDRVWAVPPGIIPDTTFHAVDYGAIGDDNTDNYVALKTLFDAVQTAGGGRVIIDPIDTGFYRFNRPLLFRKLENISIDGLNRYKTRLKSFGYRGPAIVWITNLDYYPDTVDNEIACPLPNSGALSYRAKIPGEDFLYQHWIKVDEISEGTFSTPTSDIEIHIRGVPRACIEVVFKTGSDINNLQYIAASYGKSSANATYARRTPASGGAIIAGNGNLSSAYELFIQGGSLKGQITVAGITYEDLIINGALAPNTWYLVAFQYDTADGFARSYSGPIGGVLTPGGTILAGANTAWNNVTAYIIDDRVKHGGSSWIARVANTNVEPATALPFNAATVYGLGDTVTFNEQTWRSKYAGNVNKYVQAGPDWELVWDRMWWDQASREDHSLGAVVQAFPMGDPGFYLKDDAALGPFRKSNIARYDAAGNPGMPAALWANDANTDMLLPMKDCVDIFIRGITGTGIPIWLVHNRQSGTVGTTEFVEVMNLHIDSTSTGNGMVCITFTGNLLHDLRFSHDSSGLILMRNSFTGYRHNILFSGTTKKYYSLIMTDISGAGLETLIKFNGGGNLLAVGPASCSSFIYPWFGPSRSTEQAVQVYSTVGGNMIMLFANFDQENMGPLWRCDMSLSGISSFIDVQGYIEGHEAVCVEIDAGVSHLFIGSRFNINPNTVPSIVKIISQPTNKVVFFEAKQIDSDVPWTDTGFHTAYTAGQLDSPPVTIPVGATPNISASRNWIVGAAATSPITNLLGGKEGNELLLYFTAVKTIQNNANLLLGGSDFVAAVGDVLYLVYLGGKWRRPV